MAEIFEISIFQYDLQYNYSQCFTITIAYNSVKFSHSADDTIIFTF